MLISSKLRRINIAEYLLYMWQVEDSIRACNLDIEVVKSTIVEPLNLNRDEALRVVEWYDSMIDMMKRENVVSRGHLQINKNVIISLDDFHARILNETGAYSYRTEFYSILPIIVELRSRSGNNAVGEIETCFNLLYSIYY